MQDQANSEVQNNQIQPCRLLAFEVMHWFPAASVSHVRLAAKGALSAFLESRTMILPAVEPANGNTQVIPAAPCLRRALVKPFVEGKS